MISKIVSGGQSGVDRAALDAAIRLGIPHGGWVPKGRRAEDGPLPATYTMRETRTAAYPERTERNVRDSDGTLLISHGRLRGGSEYTRQMALKHRRPFLHVDLKRMPAFQAALTISRWLGENSVRTLNVAGPRASKDPGIYQDTLRLLEAVYYLDLPQAGSGRTVEPEPEQDPPKRVRELVDRLAGDLPLKDRVLIANLSYPELPSLLPTLGEYIVRRYGLVVGNTPLTRSCRFAAKRPLADEMDAAGVIIEALWNRLRQTHPLRCVK
jgi:hypothetical protein